MFVDTSSFQIILSFHCPLRLRLLHLSAAGNCPQMSVSPDWSTYHLSLYWLELKVLPARRSSVSSPSVLFVPFLSPFWFLRWLFLNLKYNGLELASVIRPVMEHWEPSHFQMKSHKLVLLLIEHLFSFLFTKLSHFGSLLTLNSPWLCNSTLCLHAQ